jgi:uroporphyrin-3 C-methyltransferase
MTKDDEQQKDAEFPDEEALVAEERADEPEALPAPETDTASKKGSGGIAWLAVFLAFVATAGVGYTIVDDWRTRGFTERYASTLDDLRGNLASSSESLSELDQDVATLEDADARTMAAIERLRADFESRLQLVDSLPPRMANLENSVSTLQGISTGARNRWLLAEAEYYMQIANAQLQLAGNPRLAANALEMADERIVQLADPALTGVRSALADEMAALEGMEKPDIEGISLTLSSLARVVHSLPLPDMLARDPGEQVVVDEELGGLERAWASVSGAVSGLVRVTPPDELARPLMTPDAEYFLRTNLTLQIQVARLALLRGEQAVFDQSLDDASDWLDLYFDGDSAQVRGAKATIAEIREGMFTVSPPDISQSLRLLREFNSINEAAQ